MKGNASNLKVEKGIPIPPTMTEVVRSMEIGDSVFVPTDQRATFAVLGTRSGHKLVSRKVEGGHRFWRVS
jgi:hypothetical protein